MKSRFLPALLILFCLIFNVSAYAQDRNEYKIAAVGFYNLENLFDTLDTPEKRDEDFTPRGRLLWNTEKYLSKMSNMAKVIQLLGTEMTPDGLAILGVAEVENSKVLEDLCQQEAIRNRNYQVAHIESPDERGIDCGLLYQPKYFQPSVVEALKVELKDPETGEGDFTRDVLYVAGNFDGEPFHIMVCHWPSRRGGESGSAWMRAAAAAVCRAKCDSILSADPDAQIIVMGDLNDDPDNKSVTQVLNANGKLDKLKAGQLYNPMYDHFKNGNGTLAYRDAWNLFDQMIVSQPLVLKKHGGWQLYKSVVFKEPWMFQTEGAFRGYPFRTFVGEIFINGYSDHLPVYLFLLKKQ